MYTGYTVRRTQYDRLL